MKVVPRFFALRLVNLFLARNYRMKTYLVKQKFRFGGEKFDIKDDRGNVDYQVEGSFLKFPKPSPFMTIKVN